MQNPSLAYYQQQVEVMKREKALEQSRALPDLKFGYFNQSIRGTQEVNGQVRSFGPGDRFTGVTAGVSLPVWFFPFASKAKSAGINQKIAASDAEYYLKSLSATFSSLLDQYRKYSGSVYYYENQALPESDLLIEQSTKSYKAGAMDYLEYVLSLGRALEIRQNYLNALNNLNQTMVSIDFVTGKIY
jgi:cobalt-zinc-cadmium resistance protein CzcA